MENKWSRLGFAKSTESPVTIKNVCAMLKQNLNAADPRPLVLLGHGDPSAFPCFRTSPVAEEAVVDALKSAKFNSYAPSLGLLQARRLWSPRSHSCYLLKSLFPCRSRIVIFLMDSSSCVHVSVVLNMLFKGNIPSSILFVGDECCSEVFLPFLFFLFVCSPICHFCCFDVYQVNRRIPFA